MDAGPELHGRPTELLLLRCCSWQPAKPDQTLPWPAFPLSWMAVRSPAELPPLCSVFSFSQRKKKATLPLLVSLTCGTRELYFFLKSTDFVLML
jgi:hypothetical protein